MHTSRTPGLTDVIKLDTLDEIREMTQNSVIDRAFESSYPLANGVLLRRILRTLSFQGKRFPTMSAKDAPGRAAAQDLLWTSLNAKAEALREGPAELEALSRWLRGIGDDRALGVLVQEVIGKHFNPSYAATQETWGAALTMAAAIRMKNPFAILAWEITGKVRNAKKLLASQIDGDLAAVHGTGVALHNIVKSLQQMKALYVNISLRSSLTKEAVLGRCLFAPETVLRQATKGGTISGCPFHKGTLFVASLGEAQRQPGAEEMVFLEKSWSRCPAEQWVPALLLGVWKRASRLESDKH